MSDNDQHQFKDRYMLRLPDGMRDRIKAAAAGNNRSMNAEIVATLDEKYPAPFSFLKREVFMFILRFLARATPEGRSDVAEDLAAIVSPEIAGGDFHSCLKDMRALSSKITTMEQELGRKLVEADLEDYLDAAVERFHASKPA